MRVAETGAFAYHPHEVVTTAGDRAVELAGQLGLDVQRVDLEGGPFTVLREVPDPLRLIEELHRRGVAAQPNHVFFAHCGAGCSTCCGPHPSTWCHNAPVPPVHGNPVYASPVYASPVYASPVYASPVYASPVYASPVYASPVYASPVYASPVYASPAAQEYRRSGARRSSARVVVEQETGSLRLGGGAAPGAASVVILDTGFAEEDVRCQALLEAPVKARIAAATGGDEEEPDEEDDGLLDPAAGHGTFIAGIIDQLSPGCRMVVHRVITNRGDGDEVAIAQRLVAIAANADERTLVNLSFGGGALDRPDLMAWAIRQVQDRGAVVVASAGNDGVCQPTFPAALPGVVGVGALGPTGPAPFTNYGPWVRACAPGVDLLSTFFHFDGRDPQGPDGSDPDRFVGWARWSGTSFAGPVVVAALARQMAVSGCTAAEAVARVVDAPALLRIPGLGTVVNIA